jgi:hypothetical protein
MKLERVITRYRRIDDSLAGEYPVSGVRKAELRRIFPAGGDVDVVLTYPIEERQRRFAERFVGGPLNIARYEYFLEAFSAPVSRNGAGVGDDRPGARRTKVTRRRTRGTRVPRSKTRV